MHGNVYEWCEDRFRTFTREPVADPVGTETSSHCIRGGYWGRPVLSCRSAFRDSYSRGSRASIAGFRVARDLDRPHRRRAKE
jgi:formylglycine-generating enzyme required for sulfatase activity